MNPLDAFDRILASLHEATLDNAPERRPRTAGAPVGGFSRPVLLICRLFWISIKRDMTSLPLLEYQGLAVFPSRHDRGALTPRS